MRKTFYKHFLSILFCTLVAFSYKANANHLFGADFNYTWVSGNTYNIRLTIYGDCAGAFTPGSSFNGLNNVSPTVQIFKNGVWLDSISLVRQGAGIEVTPVCPTQASQTSCSVMGSTIQGVKRFIYSANYTLNGPAVNWLFQFNGGLPSPGTPFIAGRSTNITNIIPPGTGDIMRLEATLNNTVGNNSSPTYTTIPTPFFCINKPASYNPGAVDPNVTDVLSFAMVDGLEALPPFGIGGTVTYAGFATATNPIPVVPGSQTFSTTSGQLDFTPNTTSNNLVVSQVTETRGGTVVGTSMREMVFVITTCNNNPPSGGISNVTGGGTFINATTVSICKEKGLFTFNINPTDIDGDTINVSAAGVPAGATFTVTNNNTPAPIGVFSWNVSTATPGTYNFFITYTDRGCPLSSKQTIAYTVIVLPNPRLDFTLISAATCLKKAIFTLTPVGGTSPYTINFGTITRSGVTGPITDSLSPGTYTFTITGANNCTHDTTITLASPANIIPAVSIKNNTCSPLIDGSVTISASNGTAPYSYAIGVNPFGAGSTFSPLAAGSYILHIKDALGCTKDTSVTLKDSIVVHSNVVISNALCNGQASGIIQVTGTSGANPYTYALGAGAYGAVSTFSGVAAGPYVLHVKDNLGCIQDTNVTVGQPTPIRPTAVIVDVNCNGGSDGRITVNVTGGTPGYTYALGAGAFGASNVFTGLTAGSYTLHIKDNNNCDKDTTVTVGQPNPLAFTFVVTNVLCNGGSTGTVTVTATGGTTPYTYAADAGAFGVSNVLNGLNAGAHIIHLKDAHNCIKDSTITITQPAPLQISFTARDPACNAGQDGQIVIAGAGGTTAYQFALGVGAFQASGTFTALTAGTYILHLKDANGCTKDTTTTLNQPPAITVSAQVKRPRCTPLVNGAVTITAGGGSPGYTYAVGAGAYGASSVFNNLGSGTYTFHIKDTHNCIKDTTITVTDSIFLHATTVMTPARCFNEASGSIAVTPSGGDLPYTFAMAPNPFSATNPITNLAAGAYTLRVKDANGCILDTNVNVTQPTIIVPTVAITRPLCYLDTNGVLNVGASGGTPGYTFALGSGAYSASTTFNNLGAGTFVVHTKDNNGCLRDTTVTITQPTPLAWGFFTLKHLKCFNGGDGEITVRASGGTPAYTYAADGGAFQTSNVLGGLQAGGRIIHLKDNNGCTKDTTVTLYQPTQVHVLITDVVTPTCEGYKDGMVRIAATGGTPGYTYSPNNTAYDTQKTYSRLPEGVYTFYARDANGCQADTTINLIGYPHININGISITPPSCHGLMNGSFALNVTGGNQPLTYVMQSPRDTNLTGAYDSLVSRSYTVKIIDAKGCFKDTTVFVSEPDSLLAHAVITPNDCEGLDDGGGATAVVTGGTTPYTYLWSTVPVQTVDHISGMPNGSYYVIVTDAHQCEDTAIAIIPYDDCCKPYVVNAFTPNADGKNDVFRVRFKGDVKLESFSVYNRFGQRMFYTTDVNVGWDGTWNDQPQDLGTYFYYIKLICGNKGTKVLEYKGDVTLIR